MTLLSLLLLLGISPPQDNQIQPSSPNQLLQGFLEQNAHDRIDRVQRDRIDQVQSENNTCFAIRSYIFKREDGQAPELVRTVTCTPARTLQERRIGHPRARLIPAN